MRKVLPIFHLLTSASTLVCCAIPALLVSLGLGATLAGFVSNFPEVIWFSQHKLMVLSFAFLMLAISGFFIWKSRNEPCPLDADLARSCMQQRRISFFMYVFSCVVYGVGASISIWSYFV